MLKYLGIVLMSMALVCFYGNPQPHETKQGEASQHPSAPVATPPVQQNNSPCLQTKSNQHIEADVRIIETPAKDRFDKVVFWANLILAVVGVIGVSVGICTLSYIKAQVIEMRRQVTASHDGLRAWLAGNVRELPQNANLLNPLTDLVSIDPLTDRRFVWEVTNYGQTPAFIRSVAVAQEILDSLDEQPAPKWMQFHLSAFIGAGITTEHPLSISPATLRKIEEKGKFWRIIIRLGYEDIFERPHETMISFYYYVPRSELDPRRRGFHQDGNLSTNYNN